MRRTNGKQPGRYGLPSRPPEAPAAPAAPAARTTRMRIREKGPDRVYTHPPGPSLTERVDLAIARMKDAMSQFGNLRRNTKKGPARRTVHSAIGGAPPPFVHETAASEAAASEKEARHDARMRRFWESLGKEEEPKNNLPRKTVRKATVKSSGGGLPDSGYTTTSVSTRKKLDE